MLKNKEFWSGVIWLVVTGIAIYLGLCVATDYNVFIDGAWAGLAFANALVRFVKAYDQEKSKKSAE